MAHGELCDEVPGTRRDEVLLQIAELTGKRVGLSVTPRSAVNNLVPSGTGALMRDFRKTGPCYFTCGNRTLEYLKLHPSSHCSLLSEHIVIAKAFVRATVSP